eukprot:TRINITY_DN1829_c0_g5_i1.p1 TRINITY_DN1829_c0_g5~~TRINITY_DN1829_c0_g5_i1.p1  ORF type:complete len:394 (+),score=49.39 TRINITY_DN1829_c0_g5_i1:79-1182(+)
MEFEAATHYNNTTTTTNNNVEQQSTEQEPQNAAEEQHPPAQNYQHEQEEQDIVNHDDAQVETLNGQTDLQEQVSEQVEIGGSTLVTPQVKRKRGRPPSAGRTVIVRQEREDERSGSKRPRGRPRGSKNKVPRSHSGPSKNAHFAAIGQPATHQKPLVLDIHNGEDVTDRLKRFCDENQCSLVVQAATGTLSEATLTQQCTGHGVILKNTFTILSLSGALIRSAPESTVSWFLTASLAAPDGGVVGGQVAGPLTAASSVIVVIAYWSDQAEQTPQPYTSGLQLPQLTQQPQSDALPSTEPTMDNLKQEHEEEYQQLENINNNNVITEMEHDIGEENKDQNQSLDMGGQHDVSDTNFQFFKNQDATATE